MRLALVACLTVLMLAFAGCSGKGSGSSSSTTTSHTTSSSTSSSSSASSSSSHSTSSSSSTAPAPANHPPTGAVSVAVNGTSAKFSLSGSDADQDTIVWDLAFGDGNTTNGTTLPATVSHNYTKTGNLTASYTITDGKDRTTYNVTVDVSGAAGATGQTVTGSWMAGGPISCEQFADGDDLNQKAAQLEGIDFVSFPVDASTLGAAFHVDTKPTVPGGGFEVDFYDAGGKNLANFENAGPTDLTVAGTVPAGAATGVFFPCSPGPGDFTYTAG